MAIRLRRTESGQLLALCAAKTEAQAGDVYLDDEVHEALARKFWRDYPACGITPEPEIARIITEHETALRWLAER